MPKLVTSCMVRLRSVSEKLNKNGGYKLVPFKNDAFNEEIDASEIENMLTDLVDDIYGREYGNRWFQVGSDYDTDKDELFSIKIDDFDRPKTDDCDRLEIHNIVDLIDSGSGIFQFYLLFSESRKEYQWVVASLSIIYSDCKTREEMGLATAGVTDIPFWSRLY